MISKNITGFSVVVAGMTAIISQIIFLREFLIVFYGNEISIGIILASWLIWGAAGSFFLGHFVDRFRNKLLVFALAQLAIAFILPAIFFAIRMVPHFLGISAGEIIGYYPMIRASFVVLAVPCAIMGFVFSLACSIYNKPEDPTRHVAIIYVFEALGALIGGFLVSLVLLRIMTPYKILFTVTLLNILSSLLLQRAEMVQGIKRALFVFSLLLLAGAFIFGIRGGVTVLEKESLNRLWQGYDVLESVDTVYGDLTVVGSGKQRSFYENGLHLYTVPDRLTAEESVHFAMLEAESPENILLIGGGVGGLLEEILKYPVKSVDYVELDPEIIELAIKFLPEEDKRHISDPKVNIVNADGRFFVKNTVNKYDCVIISLGDPYTAQINRFYTSGFYNELNRVMADDAVVSFVLTSSENYISKELEDYLHSIYISLSAVFPDVGVVPGDSAVFLASNTKGLITLDHNILSKRLEDRGIETIYVRDYYLFDKLSPDRIEYASDIIERRDPGVKENRDFRPVSYFYATVFWGSQFNTPFLRKLFIILRPFHIWIAVLVFCLFCSVLVMMWSKRRFERTAALAVMTTGFAEINFQIAVILSFQIIYGYVFYKIGIIIASFMLGLALGGLWVSRKLGHIRDEKAFFRKVQLSICVYPLVLPACFIYFSRSSSALSSWVGANLVFPLMPIIAGFIGGVQFPLANKIYLGEARQVGRVAGTCYALDLFGACLGSLVAAAFIVPVLGVFQACFLVAIINLVVLFLLRSR